MDDAKQIIAGHGRVEAAKLLGIDAVPTCKLSHLSEAEKRDDQVDALVQALDWKRRRRGEVSTSFVRGLFSYRLDAGAGRQSMQG